MKYISEAVETVIAKRSQIGAALGYPAIGRVIRNEEDFTGRLAPPPMCVYEPELTVSDDGTVAAFDVDTATGARLPPEVVAILREEKDLPAKIKQVRDRLKEPLSPEDRVKRTKTL